MAFKMDAHENDGINEINITPFVDIVLVLLIIFMISTPAMLSQGMKVSLPQAKNSEDMSHVTLKLQMTKDAELYLDNKPVTMDALKAALKKMAEAKTLADALISADAAVPHGKVMELSDHLKSLGLTQIAFATSGGGSEKETTKK